MTSPRRRLLFLVFLLCLAGLAATFFVSALSLPNIRLDDFLHHFSDLLRSKLPPRLFILAMILLPPAGFPFSLFLALAGIRFGILDGMALTVVILPLHMIICYLVSHTFLREPLIRFLAKRGWQPPILHARRPGLAMVGFLLMPGPPYILKTYLLSLTGLPFHRFLLVNWSTEALITLPIVAMSGAAAQKNWFLFGAVLLLFVLGMVFRWLKKRRSKERRTASHNTS